MGNKEDFARLRNLAFYDDYKSSYVYFNSLNKEWVNHDDYNEARQEVLSNYEAGLANFNTTSQLATNGLDKWKQCIDFLERAVEIERTNEQNFFQQKYQDFIKTFRKKDREAIPELSQIMEQLEQSMRSRPEGITTNEIYADYISLINVLMSGIKNAKAIIKYEHEQIGNIEKALNSIKEKRQSQLEGLNKTKAFEDHPVDIEKAIKKLDNEIDNYYLTNKNFKPVMTNVNGKKVKTAFLRGAQTAFARFHVKSTVGVSLSDWINKQIIEIFNSDELFDTLVQYVAENYYSRKHNLDLASFTKATITKALVNISQEHLPDIINGRYRKIPKETLIDEIQKSIDITQEYRIEGFYPNFGLQGTHLKAYADMDPDDFNLHEASSEEFTRVIENLIDDINSDYYTLTKEQQALTDFLNKNDILKKYDKYIKLIHNLEKINEVIKKAEKAIEKKLITEDKTITRSLGKDSNNNSLEISIHITPTGVEITPSLDSVIKKLNSFQKVFGADSKMKLTTVPNIIKNLRNQGSRSIRDTLASSIDTAVALAEDEDKDELKQQLDDMVRRGMENFQVKVNGPDIDELKANIDVVKDGKTYWAGPKGTKNDAFIVTINRQSVNFNGPINTLIKNQDKKVSEMIASHMSSNKIEAVLSMDAVTATADAVNEVFAKNASSLGRFQHNTKFFLNLYTNFSKNMENNDVRYFELIKKWDDYTKYLKNHGFNEKEINDKYTKFLQSLQNSFFMSTTVKTYNEYSNKLGFAGGSIGTNLSEQLTNMEYAFNQAGIEFSKQDKDWLTSAIINCSPVTLRKEEDKPLIEGYLGTMASFMLFDEGIAEATIIDKIKKGESKMAHTTPQILHLYKVESTYIPGSFVLQKTLDYMKEAFNSLSEVFNKPDYQGAGVRIINKVSESMIPNRGLEEATDEDPWGTVAKNAPSKVNIEIYFLAGLLDVLDKVESSLNNMPLPGG